MKKKYLITLIIMLLLILTACDKDIHEIPKPSTINSSKTNISSNLSSETSSVSSAVSSTVTSSISSNVYKGVSSKVSASPVKKKSFVVKFDANGGDCNIKSMIVTNDGRFEDFPTPTKRTSHYLGWYSAKEGGQLVFLSDIKKNQTLYARWDPDLEDSIKYKDASDLIGVNKKIAEKAISIISENITDSMTDYEKVKAIHDYLVLNTAYDYDNYLNKTIPDCSYHPEGAVLYNVGVCQSYAETFWMFMDALNVECTVISGKANGGGHAWNLVKLDGEWYHVDATWDDPAPDKPNFVQYNYFLINDTQMKKDHSWSSYPPCNSTKYMYKVFDNRKFENQSDAINYIEKTLSSGANEVGFILKEDVDIENLNSIIGDYWYSFSYYTPEHFGDYKIYRFIEKQ